jgi:hypothetical protein
MTPYTKGKFLGEISATPAASLQSFKTDVKFYFHSFTYLIPSQYLEVNPGMFEPASY